MNRVLSRRANLGKGLAYTTVRRSIVLGHSEQEESDMRYCRRSQQENIQRIIGLASQLKIYSRCHAKSFKIEVI